MWPGDQQPGGGQHPQQPDQQPNPYQQPGYQQPGYPQQQPNPYQQPGYGYPQQPGQQQPGPQQSGQQQPNPYQQPGVDQGGYQQPGGGQQWGAATVPGGPQPPQGGGGKSRNTVIAIVAALAVIGAAVVTGVILTQDDDKKDEAGPAKSPSAKVSPGSGEKSADPKPDPKPSPEESKDPGDPVVPGWQSVINPKHYSAFDVPENDDWTVASQGTITGFTDDKNPDDLLVAMSAPAYFKEDWCKDSNRAIVGTKGGQGSKNTKEGAEIAASNWAIAAYDQGQKGTLKESGGKAFRNKHGIKGHTATATLTGAPKDGKCGASDAKVVTVSWINANDDLAIWVFLADAKVKDEVPDATIKKMMGSLRSYGEPGEEGEPRG